MHKGKYQQNAQWHLFLVLKTILRKSYEQNFMESAYGWNATKPILFVRNQESSLISLDINEEHKDKCQNNTYHEQLLTHTNICL